MTVGVDEATLIALLRGLPLHPGARGLVDDAAVFTPPLGRDLVLTHDVLVEGTHYLPGDPPSDVAWKLLATNLSDLAGKGAEPFGVLLGLTLLTLAGDEGWDRAFVEGLGRALSHFGVRLLGGDTVSGAGTRVLGLTAIGTVPPGGAPARSGARPGDRLWVTGTIGDAGLGLAIAQGGLAPGEDAKSLLRRYRRPEPRLAEGIAAAPSVNAMMDVSDGLLIDAARMAAASGVGIEIDLAAVPLSAAALAFGGDRAARLAAATAGDDYELLASAEHQPAPGFSCIGRVTAGAGLALFDGRDPIPLPDRLGFQHQG